MNNRTKGIICIICAAFFFGLMGLLVRLSGDIPAMQKSFFRNFIAFIIAFVSLIKSGEKIKIDKTDVFLLFIRSFFGTIGIVCNFYAIDHLLLADATILNKLSPFFAIIFSALILRERCNIVQFVAVVVAFAGAILVIKPSGDMSMVPALVGALGGLGAGVAYTVVRMLGKRGLRSDLIITVFSAFSTMVVLPFMIIDYVPMTMTQLLLLIGAGVAAAGGQFSITKAYFYAPAKQISVYDYSQIIFSALMGLIILRQIPDMYSILGYVIICSMAVWMFVYNKKHDA